MGLEREVLSDDCVFLCIGRYFGLVIWKRASSGLSVVATTLFSPARIDGHSRAKEGLSEAVNAGIEEALAGIEVTGVRPLAREVSEVKSD